MIKMYEKFLMKFNKIQTKAKEFINVESDINLKDNDYVERLNLFKEFING
jgi:hypothetical protein